MDDRLLISEPPLQCMPSLAVAFHSSDEAIILQQIHYWIARSQKVIDGRKWVYNSMTEWQKQFPWIKSIKTLRKYFDDLEKRGLLITGNFNKAKFDKTKWYSIDYDALARLGKREGKPYPTEGQGLPNGGGKSYPSQEVSSTQPIPIDYTENTHKTTTENTLSLSPSVNHDTDPFKDKMTKEEREEQNNYLIKTLVNGTGKGISLSQSKQLKDLINQVADYEVAKFLVRQVISTPNIRNPVGYLITLLKAEASY